MLKRTAKGDAEFLDCDFTVLSGPYAKRKIFANLLLDGTTAGHAKAADISRSLLRAIYESAHGLDPNDKTPAANALLAGVTLADLNGATFLATVEIEPGGKRPDGSGNYKDKNVIGRVLRIGDKDYRVLAQPPAAPIERSTPPAAQAASSNTAAPTNGGSLAVAPATIPKPGWAR